MNRKKEKLYTVSEICGMTGVTRKTLFYYDRKGLLKPSSRAGIQNHKMYNAESLERLRKILLYRSAGLGVAEVGSLLDEENCDRNGILKEAQERLYAEKAEKEEQIRILEDLIEAEA